MTTFWIVLATWIVGLPLAWALLCESARWLRRGRHHMRTDGITHLRWEGGTQFHRNDLPRGLQVVK